MTGTLHSLGIVHLSYSLNRSGRITIMIQRILPGFFLSFFLIAGSVASEDKAFFWKVESDTAVVYLFGSIHFADKSFYPLRNEIEHAFRNSDTLVVELDAESVSAEQYQHLVTVKGSYTGKETVADHISRETYQKLGKYLARMGVPIQAVEKQRPGMLALTITTLEVMRLGLDPELGIDLYFLKKARGKKKIVELETLEEQFAIFLDFPDGDLLLQETFHSMDDSDDVAEKMISFWKKGDEKKMNALLYEDTIRDYPVFASIYESLFYTRNVKMANAIKNYLKQTGRYFVVVGAGHLIGEKGVVHLLENAGFTVKRQ